MKNKMPREHSFIRYLTYLIETITLIGLLAAPFDIIIIQWILILGLLWAFDAIRKENNLLSKQDLMQQIHYKLNVDTYDAYHRTRIDDKIQYYYKEHLIFTYYYKPQVSKHFPFFPVRYKSESNITWVILYGYFESVKIINSDRKMRNKK